MSVYGANPWVLVGSLLLMSKRRAQPLEREPEGDLDPRTDCPRWLRRKCSTGFHFPVCKTRAEADAPQVPESSNLPGISLVNLAQTTSTTVTVKAGSQPEAGKPHCASHKAPERLGHDCRDRPLPPQLPGADGGSAVQKWEEGEQ